MFYSSVCSKIGVGIGPPVGMSDYTSLDSVIRGHSRRSRWSSPSNELESNVEQHSNLMVFEQDFEWIKNKIKRTTKRSNILLI